MAPTPIHTSPSSQPTTSPIAITATSRPAANHQASARECIRGLSRSRGEAITRSSHCLDETIVAEVLERLAQAADVDVDRPLLDVDVAAPDAVEQLVTRVHPLRVCHEELEHAVL